MKQVQFIRYIFDLLIAVVIYLVSTLMAKSFYNVEISIILLLFMILQIILYRKLIFKLKNSSFAKFAMIIVVIILATLISGGKNVIDIILLIGGQGVLISFFDSKDISRNYYLKILKIILGILIVSTLFHIGMPQEYLKSMVKVYILIILLSIILLRSSRNYENKIKEKNEKLKLISTVLLTFIICNERIYLLIFNIMKSFLKGISNIVSVVVAIIVYPFAKLLDILIKQLPNVNDVEIQEAYDGGTIEKVVNKVTTLSPTIATIIDIILIIALIVAIYIIFMKIKDNKRALIEDNSETIIREKIEKSLKEKKSSKKNLCKGIDNRTVIKKIFYDIQYRLKKKSLYNESYTATEVISQIKYSSDDSDKSINKIYNKAKFSTMEITDEDVNLAKSEQMRIKNELKRINKL